MIRTIPKSSITAAALLAILLTAGRGEAVPWFSIDWDSPQAGIPPVDQGAVLTAQGTGQFPAPLVVIPSGAGGLGIIPNAANPVREVDALSFGLEPQLTQSTTQMQRWSFSVDQFAIGRPGVPAFSVTTEGAVGNLEASADVYYTDTASGPVPVSNGINTGRYDGNANLTPGFPAPGLNLREPNPPLVPQTGDDLDALDLEGPPTTTYPVYFSLDSAFIDPQTGIANSGTAAAQGFEGGDVLVTTAAGGPPALYASAGLLGLNLNGVPDSDDLDALVLWENGVPGYQPTTGPYSWLGGNPTDMLLFSVRRGSNLIGTLDSILSIPIGEGDILVPMALQQPGIFVPAEALGLQARTPGITTDELDALDVELVSPTGVVPEPSSLVLLSLGAVGLLGYVCRKKFRLPVTALLALATAFMASSNTALAVNYDFLTVTGNGIAGNLATSQFTSPNGNGVINVTHSFSAGGAGPNDNNNPLIFPSQFTTTFPGTGQVQGHLAQTLYGSTSIVTFDLTAYALSSSTIFGIWNTTTDVAQPPYRLELIDSSNNPQVPSTFNFYGTQDNQAQVQGKNQLVMNLATGDISAGASINGGVGIHTNAVFWDNIPAGTKKLIVYGNLGPIPGNTDGDGVGYYFAEPHTVPEPSSIALFLSGGAALLLARWRWNR